ncbi:MAG TPA: hypothetical protein VJU61_01285 [Polyangiaceae bacterium]|nr:hypothetical protein [Polyangiaceae bacterium]
MPDAAKQGRQNPTGGAAPLLGMTPEEVSLVLAQTPRDPIAESYRALRPEERFYAVEQEKEAALDENGSGGSISE